MSNINGCDYYDDDSYDVDYAGGDADDGDGDGDILYRSTHVEAIL